MSGRQFSDYARDRLFREIVAFANARGGTLVLGVDEIEGNPPRASAIKSVQRVHDLAARLEDAARACIEPPLGALQIRGIEMEAGTETGVVIFRTVASPFGPHRVAGEGHAFIRRGASSVRMSMREIQDLTLDLARGADRLAALFAGRRANFKEWIRDTPGPFLFPGILGLRVTAAPIATLPRLTRIADPHRQIPLRQEQPIIFEGNPQPGRLGLPLPPLTARPILRGCRIFSKHDPAEYFAAQIDILDNGIVDCWLVPRTSQSPRLSGEYALGAVGLVLGLADWIRVLGEAPEWEYAIELELTGVSPGQLLLPSIDIQVFGHSLHMRPIVLPQLSWRSRAEEEDVLNLILQDIIDACGAHPWPRMKFAGSAQTIPVRYL